MVKFLIAIALGVVMRLLAGLYTLRAGARSRAAWSNWLALRRSGKNDAIVIVMAVLYFSTKH